MCFLGGSLLESILHYTNAGGKAGGKWFYPAATVALACLGGTLLLLQRPWRPENVVRRVLAILGCLYGFFIIGAWVQTRAGTGEVSTQQVIVSSLSVQGVALILVSRLLREHGMSWGQAFGLRTHPGRALLLGALAAAFFMPVGWELQRASAFALDHLPGLGLKPEVQPAVKVIQRAVSWPSRAALGLVTVLLAPLGEELLFRGILYVWIKQAGFPRLALWGTALLFALIHFNLVIFAPLLALALILAALYEWTGNLLAPIAAHSAFNALGFVLLNLAK